MAGLSIPLIPFRNQLVAQVFNLCEGFSHSLERLCHQAEKLMGNDKPWMGEGEGGD